VKATQDGAGATSSASPAATSTDVVVITRDREATPSSPAVGLVPIRSPAADALTWGELQTDMERIIQVDACGVGREIKKARAAASSATQRADKLARDLAEAHEDLLKMGSWWLATRDSGKGSSTGCRSSRTTCQRSTARCGCLTPAYTSSLGNTVSRPPSPLTRTSSR
jgi:hypothetical protein